MKRCNCSLGLLEAAIELLRTGRTSMATLLIEQALVAEQDRTKRPKLLVRRGTRART
jgi:hypothetical protein